MNSFLGAWAGVVTHLNFEVLVCSIDVSDFAGLVEAPRPVEYTTATTVRIVADDTERGVDDVSGGVTLGARAAFRDRRKHVSLWGLRKRN
jgi:hypothetical protein